MIILDNPEQMEQYKPCYQCETIDVISMTREIDDNIFCPCGRRKGAYYKIKDIRYIQAEIY